jgi:tRNA (mo5U34)-methyltransferase
MPFLGEPRVDLPARPPACWNAAVVAARPVDLREIVSSRTWFHTIDLGDGVLTPGEKDTPSELAQLHLPDLTGRTVLDVGAYDGFYSFEAERRGANRVVAADHWVWNWPGSDARGNFELARDVLGSSVEMAEVSVEDMSPQSLGSTFDVVLFLGVLYHAPDPMGYLKNLRSVTGEVAVIETVVDLLDVPIPAAAYYHAASMNGDASNNFGPNRLAVEAMLLDVGFSRVVAFDPWTASKDWGIRTRPALSLTQRLARRLRRPRSGRMVFHAYV